jgi:hypothetical protein
MVRSWFSQREGAPIEECSEKGPEMLFSLDVEVVDVGMLHMSRSCGCVNVSNAVAGESMRSVSNMAHSGRTRSRSSTTQLAAADQGTLLSIGFSAHC